MFSSSSGGDSSSSSPPTTPTVVLVRKARSDRRGKASATVLSYRFQLTACSSRLTLRWRG
jgi:hypothetical protein